MNTVSNIARRFRVSADTIRHYTKLGLLKPVRDPSNGYRHYRLEDESNLRFILSAKTLGFGLKDIQQILNVAQGGDTPCPLVRNMIEQRVVAVHQEIHDAQLLMLEMEAALSHWHDLPDRAPSAGAICHLIEAWTQRATADQKQPNHTSL